MNLIPARHSFVYGRPVRPDEFLGRQAEISTIFNRLYHGESTSVVGEPHIGKTSLLLHVAHPDIQEKYLGPDARGLLATLVRRQPEYAQDGVLAVSILQQALLASGGGQAGNETARRSEQVRRVKPVFPPAMISDLEPEKGAKTSLTSRLAGIWQRRAGVLAGVQKRDAVGDRSEPARQVKPVFPPEALAEAEPKEKVQTTRAGRLAEVRQRRPAYMVAGALLGYIVFLFLGSLIFDNYSWMFDRNDLPFLLATLGLCVWAGLELRNLSHPRTCLIAGVSGVITVTFSGLFGVLAVYLLFLVSNDVLLYIFSPGLGPWGLLIILLYGWKGWHIWGQLSRSARKRALGPVMLSLAAGSLAGYLLAWLLVERFTLPVEGRFLSYGDAGLQNWILLLILTFWLGAWSGWRVWSLREEGQQARAYLPELGWMVMGGLAGFMLVYILSPLLRLHGSSLFILLFAWAGREIWKLRKTGGRFKPLLAEFSSLAAGGLVGLLFFNIIEITLNFETFFDLWFGWFWPLYSILGALLFAWLGHQVWKRALKREHLRLALWIGGYALLGFGVVYLLYYFIEIIIYEHLEDSTWNLLAFMVMVLFGRWGAKSREARAARTAVTVEPAAAEESQS